MVESNGYYLMVNDGEAALLMVMYGAWTVYMGIPEKRDPQVKMDVSKLKRTHDLDDLDVPPF